MNLNTIFKFGTLLCMFVSCEDIGIHNLASGTPPDNELIWVGRVFSGGRQCTGDIFMPPDTKQLLNSAGIGVFATTEEHYLVCRACIICPTYSALHAARIRIAQRGLAEELGFHEIPTPTSSLLSGEWNWVNSVGGIAGHTLTPPPTVHIKFDRSGVFSYYRNDTLVAVTSFVIRRERTPFSQDTCDVIHYQDSLRFVPQTFRVDNDTLKLVDVCVDCYGHTYRRVQ